MSDDKKQWFEELDPKPVEMTDADGKKRFRWGRPVGQEEVRERELDHRRAALDADE